MDVGTCNKNKLRSTPFSGENDADNKKKSGSMSDDGMLFFILCHSITRKAVVLR